MKEIVSLIVIVVSVLGGTAALRGFHDAVRAAALEKASKGMPSLEEMSRGLKVAKPSPANLKRNKIDGSSKIFCKKLPLNCTHP